MFNFFLSLSDSAKLAQAAKTYLFSGQLEITHSFFDPARLSHYSSGALFPAQLPPLPVAILAQFFRFLPIVDTTVAMVGILFGLICLYLVYSISKQIHSTTVAVVACILFVFNPFFLSYAINYSSEIVFTTLLLLLVRFLIWSNPIRFVFIPPTLFLLFFTRQQGVLVLLALLVYLSFRVFFSRGEAKFRTPFIVMTLLLLASLLYITKNYSNEFFSPGKIVGALYLPPSSAQGSYLRGEAVTELSSKQILSKTFYNLYNFAKDPQRIIHPIILFFFTFFLFLSSKPQQKLVFQFTLLLFLVFLLAASATLPNARYIHPLLPLIGISAACCFEEVIFKPVKRQQLARIILFLFVIFPVLGSWTIDWRFRQQIYNIDKPPVRRLIAAKMAENIPVGKLTITNLDAWAAWYEGLTTMWFPLDPNNMKGFEEEIDYIVITNYLASDNDFSLGVWNSVLQDKDKLTHPYLAKYFTIESSFVINPEDNYERQEIRGVILRSQI